MGDAATRRAALHLGATLFLIALLCSRLSLVLHELVGHGLAVRLAGGEVTQVRLFWFGGGFIGYRDLEAASPAALHAIAVGGIAVELAVAALALVALRRARVGRVAGLALWILATVDLLHAGLYLAGGTFHGYGDGQLLHAALGAGRVPFAVAVGLSTVGAAYPLGRALGRRAASWVAVRGWRRAALLALALVGAGASHAALTWGELALRDDRTYATIKAPEVDRQVARELAEEIAEAEREGEPLDPAAIAVREEALREERGEVPFAPILMLAVWATALAGGLRGAALAPPGEPPAARPLVGLAAATALAVAGVALLDRWLG